MPKNLPFGGQIGRVWSRAYSLDVIKPSWGQDPRGKDRSPKSSCTWQEGKNLEDHPTMGTHGSFIFRGYNNL